MGQRRIFAKVKVEKRAFSLIGNLNYNCLVKVCIEKFSWQFYKGPVSYFSLKGADETYQNF